MRMLDGDWSGCVVQGPTDDDTRCAACQWARAMTGGSCCPGDRPSCACHGGPLGVGDASTSTCRTGGLSPTGTGFAAAAGAFGGLLAGAAVGNSVRHPGAGGLIGMIAGAFAAAALASPSSSSSSSGA